MESAFSFSTEPCSEPKNSILELQLKSPQLKKENVYLAGNKRSLKESRYLVIEKPGT